MASGHAVGTLQANGQIAIEPMMDPLHVANAVVHIANLPLGVTVLQMNIM
jgi:NADP-dependent 3-hydroxy acid dehydrogenase YdfG